MPGVKASSWLAIALGFTLSGLPVAPPEHVHEDSEHLVVHRHLEIHGLPEQPRVYSDPTDHPDDLVFDDGDGPVLALTATRALFVPQFIAAPAEGASAFIDPPATPQKAHRSADVERLIHGPPRAPTPPRAPPAFPAS
jgi:hypothetical protein